MHLFQLLQSLDAGVEPQRCKIHLARGNGREDPLDVYLAGDFEEWQNLQNKKNFGLGLVVSLIELPQRHRWLFAGVHDVIGCKPIERGTRYRYAMLPRASTDSLRGRLVVAFERTGRQSYLRAERWVSSLFVAEIRPERLQVADFPGYTSAVLSKQQLDIIVNQQNATWQSALSSVKGVYVICDQNRGKLYIGSATGADGIWGRWCAYSKTGHGGNKELRGLLRHEGPEYAANFQFGVLETADSRATEKDVLGREAHWKRLLLSRPHGYNAN